MEEKLDYVNADRLKLRDLNSTLENKVLSLTRAVALERERSTKVIAESQPSQEMSIDGSKLDTVLSKLNSVLFTLEQHSQQHRQLEELCTNWESNESSMNWESKASCTNRESKELRMNRELNDIQPNTLRSTQ